MTSILEEKFIISESVYKLKVEVSEILFPEIEPYNEDYLQVSTIHKIWYAQYGNPDGLPVVVVHGGPGGGCNPWDMRFFDSKYYRIILFDQRGAPRSNPLAELKNNSTQDSINDMEKLRQHLNIDKWLLFGGSWGTTLSLAYGEVHPGRCYGFILRGIFLGTYGEYKQLWEMRDIFPEIWEELVNYIPLEEREDLIAAYYKRLISNDPEIHMPAARSFIKYDLLAATLMYNNVKIEEVLKNDKLVLACARIFTHYCMNNFFLKENQLLNNLHKIIHLPAIIIHGRYDAICRVKMAYLLHKNWPGSELAIIQDAGHSSSEPGISSALVKATEKIKKLL